MKQFLFIFCFCLSQFLWGQTHISMKGSDFEVAGKSFFSEKLKDQPEHNIFWDVSFEQYHHYDAKTYTHTITQVQTFNEENAKNNKDIEIYTLPVTAIDHVFLDPETAVIEDNDSFEHKAYSVLISAKKDFFFSTRYFGRTEKEPYDIHDTNIMVTVKFATEAEAKAFIVMIIKTLD